MVGAVFPPCCLAWGQTVDPETPGHSQASLAQSSTGLQSQIPWVFSVPLLSLQVGKSVVGPRTFLTVWEFLWYNCSAICGSSAWWLYVGANSDLLQEGSCYMLGDPGLLQPEPLFLQQGAADLYLHRRHSNTQRQVWLSVCGVSGYWCTQGFVCAFQEFFSPALWKFYNQIPLASKVKFPGDFQSLCQIPRLENLLWVLELILTVWKFIWYNCSAVCGSSAQWLHSGVNGNLFQEGLCHTLRVPDLLQPECLSPRQATADPWLHRRHSNTQRQVWFSLCEASDS